MYIKPERKQSGRKPIYPLRVLEVGESFTVSVKKRKFVATVASRIGKELDRKFSVVYTDDEKKTVTVTRII